MKYILFTFLCLFVSLSSVAQDDPGGQTLDAMVTIQVKGLDDALWSRLSARISKEPHANVEYACVTTGVVVLRLQKLTVTEKADVMAIVRRILGEAGVKGAVEFLDIHVEPAMGNRC